jgi:hypothetical protein
MITFMFRAMFSPRQMKAQTGNIYTDFQDTLEKTFVVSCGFRTAVKQYVCIVIGFREIFDNSKAFCKN